MWAHGPACMRPFVQLSRVLGADGKLGLTMLKLNVQSALGPPDAPEQAGACLTHHPYVDVYARLF